MTVGALSTAAYIVAALLFILSLAGLSRHETARSGVIFGISGMAIALVATVSLTVAHAWSGGAVIGLVFLLVAVLVGAGIGLWRAKVVEMTGMPELIALLHSFVGLAAVLVGWNGHLAHAEIAPALVGIHNAEVFIGIFIGGVTFTGSIVAYLKLSARISSKPLMLPGKNVLNIVALLAFLALTVWFVAKQLMMEYFARFGAVRDYLRASVLAAKEVGYTETIFGRRRPFPDLVSPNRVLRENAERAALNAPIQGSAADIMKIALFRIHADLVEQGLSSRVLLQIHDELVVEVAPGEWDATERIVRDRMGGAAELSVPLDVQVGRGGDWNEAAH